MIGGFEVRYIDSQGSLTRSKADSHRQKTLNITEADMLSLRSRHFAAVWLSSFCVDFKGTRHAILFMWVELPGMRISRLYVRATV